MNIEKIRALSLEYAKGKYAKEPKPTRKQRFVKWFSESLKEDEKKCDSR